MIVADVGRAILLASIPAAALAGRLTMDQLYVVGFLVSILTIFFDVAYQSLLPCVVAPDRLLDANSKLELSDSVAQVAGPGLGGVIIPEHLQGRVNATVRVISWDVGPFRALAGGALGEAIGLRPVVLIAGIGTLFSVLWLALSPVRRLSNIPADGTIGCTTVSWR